jgi:hypothetical protein
VEKRAEMNGIAIKASEGADSIRVADAVFGVDGGDEDSPNNEKCCLLPQEIGSEAESKSGT